MGETTTTFDVSSLEEIECSPLFSRTVRAELSHRKRTLEGQVRSLEDRLAKIRERASNTRSNTVSRGELACSRQAVLASSSQRYSTELPSLQFQLDDVTKANAAISEEIARTEIRIKAEQKRRKSEEDLAMSDLLSAFIPKQKLSSICDIATDKDDGLTHLTKVRESLGLIERNGTEIDEQAFLQTLISISADRQELTKYDINALRAEVAVLTQQVTRAEDSCRLTGRNVDSLRLQIQTANHILEQSENEAIGESELNRQQFEADLREIEEESEQIREAINNQADIFDALEFSVQEMLMAMLKEDGTVEVKKDEVLVQKVRVLREELSRLVDDLENTRRYAIERDAKLKKEIKDGYRRLQQLQVVQGKDGFLYGVSSSTTD